MTHSLSCSQENYFDAFSHILDLAIVQTSYSYGHKDLCWSEGSQSLVKDSMLKVPWPISTLEDSYPFQWLAEQATSFW